MKNVLLQLEDLQARLNRPEMRFIAPAVRRLWEPRYNYLVRRDDPDAFEEQMLEKYVFAHELTRALQSEGVLLLAGSDASVATMIPGLSLLEEMEDLVDAGLAPYEVLRMATINLATFVEIHLPGDGDFGSLRTGHRADLLLVEESPLDSISNLRGVQGVMRQGRWYARAELDAELTRIAERFRR